MSEKKSILKNKYLELRENLSPYEAFKKSLHIQDFFLNSHYFSNSKTIGAYFPILNEVQTFEVIQKSLSCKKKICLPRLDNNDIIIIPGVAFDKRGYRIGYGKGYYDKFLNKFLNKNLTLIGFGYEFQILSFNMPTEVHDVKMDAIITNKEILLTA